MLWKICVCTCVRVCVCVCVCVCVVPVCGVCVCGVCDVCVCGVWVCVWVCVCMGVCVHNYKGKTQTTLIVMCHCLIFVLVVVPVFVLFTLFTLGSNYLKQCCSLKDLQRPLNLVIKVWYIAIEVLPVGEGVLNCLYQEKRPAE